MSIQETSTKYVRLVNEPNDDDTLQPSFLSATRSVEISTQTEPTSDEDIQPSGSLLGAIFILMNAILGAGILEFPFVFSKAGLITAIIILLFVLLAGGVTHLVLAKSVDLTGASNYHQLIGTICGSKLKMTAQIALLLYTVGSSIAYMVTIGDQLTDVCYFVSHQSEHNHSFYCNRQFIIPVSCCIVILPIIWIRNISSFSYVSFFSVASVFYLVVAVVVQFLISKQRTDVNVWYPTVSDPIEILSIFPVLSFGYQCHMTSVPLYAELRNRTLSKYTFVVGSAMLLVTCCYLIVGVLGFVMFGTDVDPDIIRSFSSSSIKFTISRFAITISVCMTYPVVLFIGRSALEDAAIQITRSSSRFSLRPNNEKFRIISIFSWFILTLLVATFASGIKDVISVVGSIAGTFMFFFPGCIIIARSRLATNYYFIFIGACFVALGVFVFLWNIVLTIDEHAKGHPESVSSRLAWWSS